MKKLVFQLVKFGGVGFLCFLIDFAILSLLTEAFKVNYLVSSAIAFSVSVVVNYILSVVFVFNVDRQSNKKRNFILFIVFSVIGLALTEVIMKIGVDIIDWDYRIVKITATAIIMIYNFVTRKLFLEKKEFKKEGFSK